MKINYSALRAGDYVLTTSLSLIACLIRERTAWPCNPLDTRIATHAGIIYEVKNSKGEKCFFIAEMLTKLRSSPMTDYLNNGFWGDRIVTIRRNPVYNDPVKCMQVNDRILDDLGKVVKYDYAGLVEYLLPMFRDNSSRYYCSEYVQRHAVLDGNPIKYGGYDPKDSDDIPPRRIQTASNLWDVIGWRG